MRILKLKGKSEETILEQVEAQYGGKAVVLNTQKEQASGLLKFFRPGKIVVTIAVKEAEDELAEAKKLEEEARQKEEQAKKAEDEKDKLFLDVLVSLKNRMESMESSIKQISEASVSREPADMELKQEEPKLLTHLKEKLSLQGVNKKVVDTLVVGITEDDGLEAVVEKLYSNIEDIFKPAVEETLEKVVFFVGATGVGKTTTIAKLTAKHVLDKGEKVVLFTSDTYRIAAVEQLKTYADILGVPIEIIYNESELPAYIEKWKDADHIFIDTAGRSHKNEEQIGDLQNLLNTSEIRKTFLVLSANTSPKDVKKIVETYEQITDAFDLIVTKLDETDEWGNVVNIAYEAQKPIAYLTDGQNVPSDICIFESEKIIKNILGEQE